MRIEREALETQLRQRFGHERFRPGQVRAIHALLAGRDVLAVFPTGEGKSLVYQLTSQLLPGLTVVVSPLLALMEDQASAIQELGLAVAAVNSGRTDAENVESMEQALSGVAKLLYVTPERLEDPSFVKRLRQVEVSLFVVDEAHCLSEWGHDFRPAYLGLRDVAQRLGGSPLLALTATATPWVRSDVVERLGMRDAEVIVRGVDRPNLFLEVERVDHDPEKRRLLEQLLVSPPEPVKDAGHTLVELMAGSGIVYCATTRAAQETAEWLVGWGIPADFYHGQRKAADRARVQQQFMTGELRVIAATNAFGLGVDKPDVRFVIHRDIPATLEAYYQEAGRAGRDGDPAHCILIYRPRDLGRAAFMAGSGQLTRDEVVRAREGLLANPTGTRRELQVASGLSRADFSRLVAILVEESILAERRGRLRLLVDDFDPDAVPLDREERRGAYDRSRLQMMHQYAELQACRRRFILDYFGETSDDAYCGHCDVCLRRQGQPGSVVEQLVENLSFAPLDRVQHGVFGAGVVQRLTPDSVTVLFDDAGYHTLSLALVREHDLLSRIA